MNLHLSIPAHSALAHYIAAKELSSSLLEFSNEFRLATLTARCDLPSDFEDLPDLPDRLRGALGNALERQQASSSTGWLSLVPSLHDMIFGPGIKHGSRTLSRPFALHVNISGKMLEIVIHLTGIAASHVASAEKALRDSLQSGIAIKHHSKHRVIVNCHAIHTTWQHALELENLRREIRLVHKTPMRIRSGQSLSYANDKVIPTILRRCNDLALWNGISIDEDIRRLVGLAQNIRIDDQRNIVTPWRRFSRNSGPAGQWKQGLTGHLILRGELQPFAPAFALAALFNAGSETSQGFGRVEFWDA